MTSRSARTAQRAGTSINLHIERLVVDAALIGSGQPAAVHSAVALELARLLMAAGLRRELAAGGTLPVLSAGDIQLASAHPGTLGTQIARAVYSSIADGAHAVARDATAAPCDAAPGNGALTPRESSSSRS